MSHLVGFYLWMVLPPIGHSAILHKRLQDLIKNWNFWDSAFQRYWYVLIIFMVAYLS